MVAIAGGGGVRTGGAGDGDAAAAALRDEEIDAVGEPCDVADPADVERLNEELNLGGRISRENWIERPLARGTSPLPSTR